MKFEHADTFGWEGAFRGMRNPMNSWDRADSKMEPVPFSDDEEFVVGPNDKDLALRLIKAGPEHAKFLRQIFVSVDISGALYWWKQFDCYRMGVEKNATSTMHRLTHKKFELSDFEFGLEKEERNFELTAVETPDEQWKEIDRHPGVFVSSNGRIKRQKYVRNAKADEKQEKIRKSQVKDTGYIGIIIDGKNEYVHRLVAEAFVPNPDNLPEVNHKDGNKRNNRADNLEWVTRSENAIHALEHGLRGVNGYTRYRVAKRARRFSDEDVKRMKEMQASGMTKAQIAREFKCYSSTICNILNGKTYAQPELTYEDICKVILFRLNELRNMYLETKDMKYWYAINAMLPQAYIQKRTCSISYAALANICHQRKGHKLDEWHKFIEWAHSLPNSWLIFGEEEEHVNEV